VDTPFEFSFRAPEGFSDPLLALEEAKVGYGGTALLHDVRMILRPGSRIGLLGRNGAGKSTLVKLLAGEIAALAGQRQEGRHLKIGYFAQHQMELLRPEDSPLQHLARREPQTREQELRDYLGGFDFRGPMADAPCGPFSGGEKARLALALMIRTRPNLLLLDEPTNHLDLEMREALTLALQETEAAVVLVSHDRHLLRTTVDELWLVADGQAKLFDGDLDDYADWLAQRRASARSVAATSGDKTQRIEVRAAKKSVQAERRKLEKEAAMIEGQLVVWQAEKSALAGRLADPDVYADHAAAAELASQDAALANRIETAELRWLEVHEQLEALAAE
jgi:ATP-binding cassette subfamily F protein 3